MSDDLFGNVSSDEEDSKSLETPAIIGGQKADAARKLLEDLSDDDDEDEEKDEDEGVLRPSKVSKVKSVTTDEDEDVIDNDDDLDLEEAQKAKMIEKLKFDSRKKKSGENFLRKKASVYSELHVPSRRLSLDRENIKTFFVKLPKFVKIANESFDPMEYNADLERTKYEAASAVIRWTSDPTNPNCIISNGALVEYDDGTFELVVGESVFNAKTAPAENCFIFEQSKCQQIVKPHPNGSSKGNLTEDFQEEKLISCTCLVCCGSVDKRFIFEPTSLDSAAHHRIHVNVRSLDANRQEKKIGTMDLEKLQETQIINQKQFEKLDEKRRSFARQKKRAAESQPRRFVAHHRPYMSSQYLEGDEYEEDYEDDEEDEGKLVERPKKQLGFAKKRKTESDEDEGDSVGHDDEERSVDDDDDGADLDDFIDREEHEDDEQSAESEEDEEESVQEDNEESDEEEDNDASDTMSVDEDDDHKHSSYKKKKDKKKDKKKLKKDKLKKLMKQSKSKLHRDNEEKLNVESKKRLREENDLENPIDKEKLSSKVVVKNDLRDDLDELVDEEEEQIIVHQSKKQRKVLLDSDEED
jgi:hypothetical protein